MKSVIQVVIVWVFVFGVHSCLLAQSEASPAEHQRAFSVMPDLIRHPEKHRPHRHRPACQRHEGSYDHRARNGPVIIILNAFERDEGDEVYRRNIEGAQ